MIFAFMGLADVIPFIVFGCFVFGVWAMLSLISQRNSRAQERLARLSRPASLADIDLNQAAKKDERYQGVMETAKALSGPLMPHTELEQSAMKVNLANAGFRSESALSVYLGIRFATLMIFGVLGCAIFVPKYGVAFAGLKWVIVMTGFGFYLPQIILWWLRRKRQLAIFLSLPDALDLLVVCVESGLGLDAAMRKVCDEMKDHARVISDELALCNLQMQVGRPCGNLDPGGPFRLEHRPGAARTVGFDADAAPANRGGEGGQDGRAVNLPAGAVHLPRNLCGPRGTGGD